MNEPKALDPAAISAFAATLSTLPREEIQKAKKLFIPALIGYRSAMKAARQKILNAIEVWKDDLGSDYQEMLAKLGY